MNIYKEFRVKIIEVLEDLKNNGTLSKEISFRNVIVEPPRDRSHGELATNAAMVVAKQAQQNPLTTAELLRNNLILDERVNSISVVNPGFLNFTLNPLVWYKIFNCAVKFETKFGSSNIGRGKTVNIEYVSANPTGPLHVGHTRGAVFGDTLANLLQFIGFQVTREYYINDAGSQIDSLARSVYLRYLELHGNEVDFSGDIYPGEYLIEVAKDLKKSFQDKLINLPEQEWIAKVKEVASDAMLSLIKDDLAQLGVRMDSYYSEKKLNESGKIEKAMQCLASKNLIYEGTLAPPKGKLMEDYEGREQTLFKSTRFGDDVDRPIKKSDGTWTYFAPDAAYHFDKIERGFDELIDVFGADHSGYVKRMKAVVKAFSDGKVNLDVKLCQLVRLFKDGSPYKMSKRAGNFVTLNDMISEVGKDVVRFLMLTRKNDAQLDFDFDKALEQSKDNVVFYVQYAHARCSSIIEKSMEFNLNWKIRNIDEINLSLLSSENEKRIILKICEWPRVVESAGLSHEPHRIVFYLSELAHEMHSFQHEGKLNRDLRVLTNDKNTTIARLSLIIAIQNVIRIGLGILGVSPLTKM